MALGETQGWTRMCSGLSLAVRDSTGGSCVSQLSCATQPLRRHQGERSKTSQAANIPGPAPRRCPGPHTGRVFISLPSALLLHPPKWHYAIRKPQGDPRCLYRAKLAVSHCSGHCGFRRSLMATHILSETAFLLALVCFTGWGPALH